MEGSPISARPSIGVNAVIQLVVDKAGSNASVQEILQEKRSASVQE
jgi:hypothetical protein